MSAKFVSSAAVRWTRAVGKNGSVPTIAAWSGGVGSMQGGDVKMQIENIMRYVSVMGVFKSWFEGGLISQGDLRRMDTIFCEKYGISSCSIYRDFSWLIQAFMAY